MKIPVVSWKSEATCRLHKQCHSQPNLFSGPGESVTALEVMPRFGTDFYRTFDSV